LFGNGFTPLPFIGNGSSGGTDGFGNSGGNGGGIVLPASALPGSSLSNPITPDQGTSFVFEYNVMAGGPGDTTPLYFDPPVSAGYLFEIISGPNFASVEVPGAPAGATQLTLTFGTHTASLTVGIPFYFTSVDPAGVSQFTITGIFPDDGTIILSQTFDTAITFVGGGPGSFSQTPFTAAPEPGSLIVWGLGAAALFGISLAKSQRRA
jgi:hypothetical protein